MPPLEGLPSSGSQFIGETGTLILPHVAEPMLYFDGKPMSKEYELADDQNHYHGWIDGCLSGKQPSDGFDYGSRLTEVILLGNIATRYRGQQLDWDGENMKFTNNEDANRWLTRDYREGWELKKLIG